MQFSPHLRDRVADGTITVSYHLWSRPKVKVGGVYRSGSVAIEIDDIELLPFSSITDEDLARTGENDVEALRRRADALILDLMERGRIRPKRRQYVTRCAVSNAGPNNVHASGDRTPGSTTAVRAPLYTGKSLSTVVSNEIIVPPARAPTNRNAAPD